MTEEKYFLKLLEFIHYIFNNLNVELNYGNFENYSPNNFIKYYEKKLDFPLKIYKINEYYNIELREKYITINTKCYGTYLDNWNILYKDKIINLLNNYNYNIILLGDNKYLDNNEYKIHNNNRIKIHVMYNDLKLLNNIIDYTFQEYYDIIDINILKRNIYILNNSILNITFSSGGTNILSKLSGNTVSFSDEIDEWMNEYYENIDNFNHFYNFDEFYNNLKIIL